jgi:glycosyltransferase involved in cell wall biosynthesis
MVTSEWPVPHAENSGLFIAQQVEYLRSAGTEVDVFHFRGKKNPLHYSRAWIALRRRLRRRPYDLIHAQFGQSGLLALPKRLPLVVTFHGSDVHGFPTSAGRQNSLAGRFLSRISRWVASRADAAIVVSRRLGRCLPGARSIHTIPCGVDLDLFRPMAKAEARSHLGWPQDERIVLFAGNPSCPIKRCSLARKAVEHLSRSTASRLITAWGVPHTEMPFYMNASDVLVVTSTHEGSPGVVKEALACNLPVVSVDVGDVAERISRVEGCEVCAVDRPEAIAAALERALHRPGGLKGRASVRDLDERRLAQEVIQVYHQVAERATSTLDQRKCTSSF